MLGIFVYAATIILSSMHLFLVQPIIAKQILPWFGGAASVWMTSLFFFQFILLLGYCYAHALSCLPARSPASNSWHLARGEPGPSADRRLVELEELRRPAGSAAAGAAHDDRRPTLPERVNDFETAGV